MMSVELGMANEYIRQLSANTARGLRQKARTGVYPGLAPIGYLNDPRTKTIRTHKKNSVLVREMFERYASGGATLNDLALFLENSGVLSKGNKRVNISRVSFILQNPFYYGHFRYAGEVYEGKHEPIITKALYDKANTVLRSRGRTPASKAVPSPYCGLLRCGECGMGITAEVKEKHQKNGNIHHYTYYRCTRKSKVQKCTEVPIRSELLESQLTALLGEYAMPAEWVSPLNEMLNCEATTASQTASGVIFELRAKVEDISRQLSRLTDLYVAEDLEREDYLARRRSLTSNKRTLDEKIVELEQAPSAWVEPVKEWILDASRLGEVAKSEDPHSKKSSLQKIFGLNLSLHAREARGIPALPWRELHCAKMHLGKTGLISILEPMIGIEPMTSSFAYTKSSITRNLLG
jgi:hypothetical protein